jgi:signal transduction histidine kinase
MTQQHAFTPTGLSQSIGGIDASTVAELLDHLPVGVAVIGPDDSSLPILYLNPLACEMAGAGARDLIGLPLDEALPSAQALVGAVREAHELGVARRVRYRPGTGRTWEFDAVSLPAGVEEHGERVLGTWRQVASVEAPGGSLDLGSVDPGRLMERTLRWTAEQARTDLVVLLRRDGDELVPEASFDRDGAGVEAPERIELAADRASRRCLELGRPVLQTPEPLGAHPEGSRLRDLRHSARVPLTVAEEPSGLLLLLGRRLGDPFTEELSLVRLADQAAPGIRAARLYEQAQRTARRLQVGVDAALEVATRLEPEEVVASILRRALEAVDAEQAMLARLEDGFRCTVLGSVDRSEDPPAAGLSVSLEGHDPALRAIRALRPAQGRVAYEQAGQPAPRWSLVIPLVVGGELIALLDVGRDRRRFDEGEVAVLQQIGAMAALAFRNSMLFQSLRDASRVRSQFLNMAAHELRTPLAVIGGYVSMLADGTLGPLPGSWEAPLAVLVDKTRELAHLIDDILLAGRLESGVAKTSGRSMSVSESLREAARRAGPRADLLGAELVVRAPVAEVQVWANPDHVARILDNLVNNALNYSSARPRVGLELAIDGGAAVVRVEDSGRGIAIEHRERIFQQFYRVEDPNQGYLAGTGLGLFISRGLAERYGGRLELEWSEPGTGSRFALRLPLAAA